jgi:hypothetical protein
MTLVVSSQPLDSKGMSYTPRQCPYCELRFETHNEVKDHILREHPDHEQVAATVEIYELPHA